MTFPSWNNDSAAGIEGGYTKDVETHAARQWGFDAAGNGEQVYRIFPHLGGEYISGCPMFLKALSDKCLKRPVVTRAHVTGQGPRVRHVPDLPVGTEQPHRAERRD
jgi:hypothetical protein